MYLIFDTETTGLPKRWDAPFTDVDNWPRVIQIAWQLHDDMGQLVEHQDYLITPDGFDIPYDAERIHGISTALAQDQGLPLATVLEKFNAALARTTFVVGQNLKFDLNVTGAEFERLQLANTLQELPVLDTCTEHTAQMLKLPGGRGGKFKLPTLTELHQFLFHTPFNEAHNATADVAATTRCFLELIRREEFTQSQLKAGDGYFARFRESNPETIQPVAITHVNLKKASSKLQKSSTPGLSKEEIKENLDELSEATFTHLHNHSQFSILQSTASVQDLVNAAVANDMPAVAMTDHANMMGAFEFIRAVNSYNATLAAGENEQDKKPLKAIIGCEFHVCEDMHDRTRKDNGYQIVILAKNKEGYHNLAKMASLAYTQGFYYVPRIDKKTVETYKEGLIVLTGNMYGEVPSKILNEGESQAEDAFLWWKEQFGGDFYVELMRHGQDDEDRANEFLIQLARKHDVQMVATNNTYYIHKEDANAHDILLCVKDNEKQATPIGRGRGYRYGLPNQEYYFKSGQEMKQLFKDLPEAILNIASLVDKIEAYELARDVLLPAFDIPEKFQDPSDAVDGGKRGENAYLKHLAYEGAVKRYGDITPEIQERLDFELATIEKTGYPGYFLIVWDFIKAAREMGVAVGPGRGSAAGSAVAYCLWITNVDPIHYDLLFERFLNPDRVSMPDIDIDFDDENRGKVMDYVIDKYGADQVAQIVTYGTMAAKSSIRDTARVLDLPLNQADHVAKLIPDFAKLKKIFGLEDSEVRSNFRSDEVDNVMELRAFANGTDQVAEMLKQAIILEGSVRNTGVHACGVIITPGALTNYVPIATAKNSDLYVTQFDNNVVESAGLLKMDFLGLKTLSQIKDTIAIIKERHEIDIDIETIPLDDLKTYELFQRGETVGIFQYESGGMQKYMRDLKPTQFADLIAMNALYRPGPIEYIPDFIDRKHGVKEIVYDLPAMEDNLKETYGITVYQEQVMLLSQKLANFSKGDADVLRKAMGKKQMSTLQKMKPQFLDAGEANGHDRTILEKVWKDWEAFASYAFNKSHSTCYAWIGYQTAYLKANYPAEFMAATLSNNMNNIKDVTKFMDECKRMGLEVLGPDVNESNYKFTVNARGAVRFGMGAVKGLGHGAVMTIIDNRKDGPYKSIFDFAKRIDLRNASKKAFEALALSGGFDGLGAANRAQFFYKSDNDQIFLEHVIKYGAKYQENENSAQVSLFGDASEVQIPEPQLPQCEDWGTMEKLKREREVVGIYISGHPLDDYKKEMEFFCNTNVSAFKSIDQRMVGMELNFCGVISEAQHRVSKSNQGWGSFIIEDYEDSFEFRIFKEEYLTFQKYLIPNSFIYCKVKVTPGWRDKEGRPTEPRLSFIKMEQLQSVMGSYAKKLIIEMNVNELENNQVETLKEVLDKHKGDHRIDFLLKDYDDKIAVNMTSRLQRVQVTNELLGLLDGLDITYKVES